VGDITYLHSKFHRFSSSERILKIVLRFGKVIVDKTREVFLGHSVVVVSVS